MNIPITLKYTKSHEWIMDHGDGTVSIGITDHAQELLGDMVFVQLPNVDQTYACGDDCAVVESVKSAADIYAPVAGTIFAVNHELSNTPENINQDAYGSWIFKIRIDNKDDLDALLSADDYQKVIDEES